jgi:hypothetical protein
MDGGRFVVQEEEVRLANSRPLAKRTGSLRFRRAPRGTARDCCALLLVDFARTYTVERHDEEFRSRKPAKRARAGPIERMYEDSAQ